MWSIESVATVGVVAAGVALWYRSLQARETALAVTREACRELALQPLDQSVALRRIRLTRDRGRIRLRRLYGFEFSTDGSDRLAGQTCLVGMRAEWVRVEYPDGTVYLNT
ncbi:MAG: DUF3301 domain-containing protein [Gammaproteobacteria bacterium]|nr:DUF3301 domain-containing protein [Gammaproteobacteria bacterium]